MEHMQTPECRHERAKASLRAFFIYTKGQAIWPDMGPDAGLKPGECRVQGLCESCDSCLVIVALESDVALVMASERSDSYHEHPSNPSTWNGASGSAVINGIQDILVEQFAPKDRP